jgi:hypothetical protein
MKTSFIVWLGYHRRSELLAEHLGASLHFVRWGRSGSVIQAPFRYVVQTWKTWRILRQERPDVVVVQNPPIFCALAVYLYTRWRPSCTILARSRSSSAGSVPTA